MSRKIQWLTVVLLFLMLNSLNVFALVVNKHSSNMFPVENNRSMYLTCSGHGYPTVLLEAGYRNNSDVWTVSNEVKAIFPAVAKFSRVCVYDRPGTIGWSIDKLGRSDKVAMPREGIDIAHDLHALLQAAGERGPFLLVGHSLGGMFVRIYASLYPNDVVGLILVDAFPEMFKENLGPIRWQSYLKIVSQLPKGFTAPLNFETIDFDKISIYTQQLTKSSPLHTMPLTVLSRGLPIDFSMYELDGNLTSEQLEEAWLASQNQLALLVPNAKHVIAKKSSHYIQATQPQLIIDAIKEMVKSLRINSHRP